MDELFNYGFTKEVYLLIKMNALNTFLNQCTDCLRTGKARWFYDTAIKHVSSDEEVILLAHRNIDTRQYHAMLFHFERYLYDELNASDFYLVIIHSDGTSVTHGELSHPEINISVRSIVDINTTPEVTKEENILSIQIDFNDMLNGIISDDEFSTIFEVPPASNDLDTLVNEANAIMSDKFSTEVFSNLFNSSEHKLIKFIMNPNTVVYWHPLVKALEANSLQLDINIKRINITDDSVSCEISIYATLMISHLLQYADSSIVDVLVKEVHRRVYGELKQLLEIPLIK